jgi:hypothetical protein
VRLPLLPDLRQPSPRVSTDQTDGKSPLTFLPLLAIISLIRIIRLIRLIRLISHIAPIAPILQALWGSPVQGLRVTFDAAAGYSKGGSASAGPPLYPGEPGVWSLFIVW